MTSRPLDITAFLDKCQWADASAQALDGDFSPRRYARLMQPDGRSAILMDADADQKTPQFVALASVLRGIGVRTPEIIAADAVNGLVLMEDFGSRNWGALLDSGEAGLSYYRRAAEILAQIHRGFDASAVPSLSLPCYDSALFTAQAELFLDAYVPYAVQREVSDGERQDFCAVWRTVLHPLEKLSQSLLLRDYMPDNLMVLPQGELGVLDFQDAGVGPVAYDLASLCEEVRRDGGYEQLPAVIAHYCACAQRPLAPEDFMRACTILSAQRHIRILGIVAQLAISKGRRDKLAYVPRLQQHVTRLLAEPCLTPVREWMEQTGLTRKEAKWDPRRRGDDGDCGGADSQ